MSVFLLCNVCVSCRFWLGRPAWRGSSSFVMVHNKLLTAKSKNTKTAAMKTPHWYCLYCYSCTCYWYNLKTFVPFFFLLYHLQASDLFPKERDFLYFLFPSWLRSQSHFTLFHLTSLLLLLPCAVLRKFLFRVPWLCVWELQSLLSVFVWSVWERTHWTCTTPFQPFRGRWCVIVFAVWCFV